MLNFDKGLKFISMRDNVNECIDPHKDEITKNIKSEIMLLFTQ